MSIYELLSFDIPVLAYTVLHQPRKSVTAKEYAKSLLEFRTELKEESGKIQTTWQNYIAELTAKTEQTTRGNLSQFLSTPIQSDTGDIQNIISDQISQTADQLLPKIQYGLKEGYDGRFLIEATKEEIPKGRAIEGRSFFQNIGFKIGRNNSSVFESLYIIQGGSNLDILEHLVRSRIGIYNSSHGTKVSQSDVFACSVYNLLFLDGIFEHAGDRFELQVRFAKGKESYELYHGELNDTLKIFRFEVHDLNVSVWQKKLGLGIGEEYILRVRTKDRTSLRASISVLQNIIKGKGLLANSLGTGTWLTKEIV
jgi:hypothetical protein